MTASADSDAGLPSYRAPFLVALVVIFSLTMSFGGWAMYARLDSAVVSQGVLLAESQRKTVEHLEGGILKRLLVSRGDHVTAGQVVAELDATPRSPRRRPLTSATASSPHSRRSSTPAEARSAARSPRSAGRSPNSMRSARLISRRRPPLPGSSTAGPRSAA
jgi:multidrug efflux pump subunit AcrA (membrane-fusion protein)